MPKQRVGHHRKQRGALLRYQLVPADAPEAVDQIAAAEAVVLLWDVKEPEVWRGILGSAKGIQGVENLEMIVKAYTAAYTL